MPLLFIFLLSALMGVSCRHGQQGKPVQQTQNIPLLIREIGQVPLPPGFTRLPARQGSFAYWLRKTPLRKDRTVYLYNNEPKPNQHAQYAVLDISTGKKNLQQCADAVMRLRAEYLFATGQYAAIRFTDYEGRTYAWQGGNDRAAFDRYLENVFGWCGSASLEKQLQPVSRYSEVEPGDVLIKGGFPGHAMIVADLAVNTTGQRVCLLVQGYQPAQDMHVLVNPTDGKLSPWYFLKDGEPVVTPEWTFGSGALRRW